MNCSFNETFGQPRILRALALTFFCGSAVAGPTPINADFDDQQILVTLPEPSLATTAPPSDPEQLAELIQAQIQQARSTGDPRFLGYAEGLLQQWNAMTKIQRSQALESILSLPASIKSKLTA